MAAGMVDENYAAEKKSIRRREQNMNNMFNFAHRCGSSSVVEHQLPKLRVVGSIPISRSKTL